MHSGIDGLKTTTRETMQNVFKLEHLWQAQCVTHSAIDDILQSNMKRIAYCVQNLTRKVQVDCFLISVLFNRKKESSLEKKERKNTKHDNNVISVSLSEQTAFHDDRGR